MLEVLHRSILFLLILLTITLTCTFFLIQPTLDPREDRVSAISKRKSYRAQQISHQNESTKYILFWNAMFDSETFYLGNAGFAPFESCKFKHCYATGNKSHLPVDQFDAILYHGVQYSTQIHGTPVTRHPSQRYIFASLESPVNMQQDLQRFDNFYNWTMTYRRDSDIFYPYGRVHRKDVAPETQQDYLKKAELNEMVPSFIKRKKKLAAWFVSNCQTSSKRLEYVREMQKYISVDIYGKCGPLQCPKSDEKQCAKMVEDNYKFYFSFENSLCADYVTEKLFKVLELNVVPVVYGSANYYLEAPPHSVINVQQFDGPEELSRYLKYLNENDEKYWEYFAWKRMYWVNMSNRETACELCKKLHDEDEPVKVYNSIEKWWNGENDSICKKPPILK